MYNQSGKSSVALPWLLFILTGSIFAWYVSNNNSLLPVLQGSQDITINQQKNDTTDAESGEADNVVIDIQNDSLNNTLDDDSVHAGDVVSYHEAVSKASQSVVNIYTTQKVVQQPYADDPFLRRFFDLNEMPQQQKDSTSLGSGVVISADGYIVTNAHVISKADEIIVAFQDGRKSKATVIGTDSESDLAVIQVPFTDLIPLPFKEEAVKIGDVTLAIGNPFGVGQTVTQGIISATGRTGLGVNTYEDFIQTDAAINPGNSGGALVDAYGNLVGINTMIFSRSGGSMGIGFAIPNVIIKQVTSGLIENGKVSRGWLGIEVKSQPKDPASLEEHFGVMVMAIVPNSPAAASGLIQGDVILRIDGQKISDANALVQHISRKQPNTALIAEVKRGDELITMEIVLAERPTKSDLLNSKLDSKRQQLSEEDKQKLLELEQQMAELFGQ